MNLREIQVALADDAIGRHNYPVEIIDPDGFVHEIVTATWDDENHRFVLRTKYVAAEITVVEPERT